MNGKYDELVAFLLLGTMTTLIIFLIYYLVQIAIGIMVVLSIKY